MTKEKKVQTLTIEEKLEQALLADWEQPYRVPANWLWVRIEGINTFQGTSVDPSKTPKQVYELYSVPIFETNYPEIVEGGAIGSTKQKVEKDDVLLCKINPRINRVWRVFQHTNYPLIASSEWIVIRSTATHATYLQYCLSSQYFRELLLSNVSGVGGSLMRSQPKYVKTYPIPLPPPSEQQRIITRIESLFEKLDNARELVQSALDSFDTRKAAILHKAFAGELTAKWRKENRVGMESWEYVTLSEVVTGFKYGTSEKSDYAFSGLPVIRIPNILDNSITFTDIKYLSSESIDENLLIQENDILIIRSNGSRDLVGKNALVPKLDKPYTYASYLIRLRPKETVNVRFIQFFLNSTNASSQMFKSAKSSAGINNINTRELGAITLLMPSYEEQQEIVRILCIVSAKEQQAKDKLEPILDQIDMMKKSLLARAFRGELGTNDPREESAIELLKEVLQQKEALSAKKIVAKRHKPIKIPIDIAKAMETSLEKDIYTLIKKNEFLSIDSIMNISSKKLNIIDALRKLEQKNIICKKDDGLYYCLG